MDCNRLFLSCCKCGGRLLPNYFYDKETGSKGIDGLTCSDCFRNVITSEMSLSEYKHVVSEAYAHNKIES